MTTIILLILNITMLMIMTMVMIVITNEHVIWCREMRMQTQQATVLWMWVRMGMKTMFWEASGRQRNIEDGQGCRGAVCFVCVS